MPAPTLIDLPDDEVARRFEALSDEDAARAQALKAKGKSPAHAIQIIEAQNAAYAAQQPTTGDKIAGFASGVGDTLSLNLADEAAGVGAATLAGGRGLDPVAEYQRARDEQRAGIAKITEKAPGARGAGELAGTVLPLVAGGAAAQGARAASAAGKAAATPLSLLARGAGSGAAWGGVGGFGAGEGVQGSLEGAGYGAAAGAALGTLGAAIPALRLRREAAHQVPPMPSSGGPGVVEKAAKLYSRIPFAPGRDIVGGGVKAAELVRGLRGQGGPGHTAASTATAADVAGYAAPDGNVARGFQPALPLQRQPAPGPTASPVPEMTRASSSPVPEMTRAGQPAAPAPLRVGEGPAPDLTQPPPGMRPERWAALMETAGHPDFQPPPAAPAPLPLGARPAVGPDAGTAAGRIKPATPAPMTAQPAAVARAPVPPPLPSDAAPPTAAAGPGYGALKLQASRANPKGSPWSDVLDQEHVPRMFDEFGNELGNPAVKMAWRQAGERMTAPVEGGAESLASMTDDEVRALVARGRPTKGGLTGESQYFPKRNALLGEQAMDPSLPRELRASAAGLVDKSRTAKPLPSIIKATGEPVPQPADPALRTRVQSTGEKRAAGTVDRAMSEDIKAGPQSEPTFVRRTAKEMGLEGEDVRSGTWHRREGGEALESSSEKAARVSAEKAARELLAIRPKPPRAEAREAAEQAKTTAALRERAQAFLDLAKERRANAADARKAGRLDDAAAWERKADEAEARATFRESPVEGGAEGVAVNPEVSKMTIEGIVAMWPNANLAQRTNALRWLEANNPGAVSDVIGRTGSAGLAKTLGIGGKLKGQK